MDDVCQGSRTKRDSPLAIDGVGRTGPPHAASVSGASKATAAGSLPTQRDAAQYPGGAASASRRQAGFRIARVEWA